MSLRFCDLCYIRDVHWVKPHTASALSGGLFSRLLTVKVR